MLGKGTSSPKAVFGESRTYFLEVMIENSLQAEVLVSEVELLVCLLFVLDFLQVKHICHSLGSFKNPLPVRRTVARPLSLSRLRY